MSPEQVGAIRQQLDMFRDWYSNPPGVAGATYMEILPVGLVVAIFTALVLN